MMIPFYQRRGKGQGAGKLRKKGRGTFPASRVRVLGDLPEFAKKRRPDPLLVRFISRAASTVR